MKNKKQQIDQIKKISNNINNERLKQIEDVKFLQQELDIIFSMKYGIKYYQKLLSIDLDKNNPNNSYVMWILNKVNNIDLRSRCIYDIKDSSLPDIDTDFPASRREEVIHYLKQKYGDEYVCQIATFGTLKGKAALKEVFRVFEVCDFSTINEITKPMPNEADIADELEEQGEESIIRWCLVNQPKMFKDYCLLNEDGSFSGEYGEYFKMAIELEGIHKSQGKHAAGVVVSSEKLHEVSPMIYEKSGESIVALDKKDAEKIGLVKFDLLGLSCLDKLMTANNLLRFGKVSNE